MTKQPHINNPTMILAMPWDVNQIQGGPRYGWGGNRFNNQNQNFSNNQGYDPNGSLLILIKIVIKERELYQNLYKLVNQDHLPKLLGIRPVVTYQ